MIIWGALWCKSLSANGEEFAPSKSIIELDLTSEFNRARLAKMQKRETVDQRANQGQRVVVALALDGTIIGYNWMSLTSKYMSQVGRVIRLGPGEAYLYDSLVLSEFRGHGLFSLMLIGAMDILAREGIYRFWGGVKWANSASIRSLEKIGFAPALNLWAIEIWGHSLIIKWLHKSRDRRLSDSILDII